MTLVPAALALATCFGLGYVPVAPGTFGSAAGLLVWAALPPGAGTQAAAIALLLAVGSWSAGVVERHVRATDPGPVIVDEVAGMLISLFMVPVGWPGAAVGFVLFRIFDVTKPPPADRLERLSGGVGIMADDVMAGVYANLALRLVLALSGTLAASSGFPLS